MPHVPASWLQAVHAPSDLTAPPPVAAGGGSTWEDVAVDDVDRGLERWACAVAGLGRDVAVDAALALLDRVAPIWTQAAADGAPGTESTVENAANGFNPDPADLHARLAAWRRAPTVEGGRALFEHAQGDHLDLFDAIGYPEFREMWADTWMFSLLAIYAAAQIPGVDDALVGRELARVAIASRRALDPEHGADAPLVVWRTMAG